MSEIFIYFCMIMLCLVAIVAFIGFCCTVYKDITNKY
jgi:hypothetical protein